MHDTWHMTHDMWQVTHDGGVNILSKFQLPSSCGLAVKVFWRFGGNGSLIESVNQLITRLFVEQLRLHRVY